MKNYIFVVNGVEGISGAIIYVRNKMLYLKQLGWNVKIVYANTGEIYIEELKEIGYQYDFMKNYPAYYNKKILDEYLHMIIEQSNLAAMKNCYIESTNYRMACWAELLAEKLEATHLIYMVTENPYFCNKNFWKFFRFKLQRGELKGIQADSMQRQFDGYQDVESGDKYYLDAYCSNSIENVKSRWNAELDTSVDYHICTVGRIEKKYMIPMVEGIIEFVKKYDKKIQMFIFGGAYVKEAKQKLINKLELESRIKYIITDFIFPVPAELLSKMDVSISSSGAAKATCEFGIPTIVMDGEDGLPIGILGYTTNNIIYREENDIIKPLEVWMEEILIKNCCEKAITMPDVEYAKYFEKHMMWLDETCLEHAYYDTRKLINEGTFKTPYRLLLCRILGARRVDKLQKLIQGEK